MRRLLLIFIAVLIAVVVAGVLVLRYAGQPYKGYAGDEAFVEVPSGSGVSAIGRRLVDAGVVRNMTEFRLAMRLYGGGRTLKAGEYRFVAPLRPSEVVDKLARGEVYLRPITFPEGLTAAEMADIAAANDFGPRDAFLAATRNAALIRDVDREAADLEGYLFPETYALPRHDTPALLVGQMAKRFLEVYDEGLRRDAAARGMTTRQVVTLASLIEKEASRPDERPLVSAVYHNRLRIGMALYCDPTVIYALQRAGRWHGNLTKENLGFDSPYNTYRYPGLPPGPIAAPGRASLEAAVRPAAVTHLYFVSRNDGSHVFATTLEEHNRNVQEFQVKYFREKRAAARAAAGGRR
jgi:UPF0755 protein